MNAVVDQAKPRRQQLQPYKSELREAFRRACDLVERKQAEIATLRSELERERVKDKGAFGIVFVLGMLVGAILTMLGGAA